MIEEIKTPVTDLDPWQVKTITGYWDLANINTGTYDANITVYYKDQKTSQVSEITVEKELGLESVEIPKKTLKISPSTILVIAVIALIIINVFLFIYLKKKENHKTKKR